MEPEKGKKMKRWIHRIFVILVLGVFVVSAVKLGTIYMRYRSSRSVQQEAVEQFTRPAASSGQKAGTAAAAEPAGQQVQQAGQAPAEGTESAPAVERVYAPIEVDFARLKGVNRDIVGWIYCEDTVINYPVLYGRDNEYYLERNYTGGYDPSGAIFTDMRNEDGFADNNVILYGHHMQDGSMFASLRKWFDSSYYAEHPVMWLLTPEQDYRVDLFAGYVTYADSQTYSIFHQPGPELGAYLNWARSWSAIASAVETGEDGHYIVMSTCAYDTEESRSVLHGKLVPVDSAGGIPIR